MFIIDETYNNRLDWKKKKTRKSEIGSRKSKVGNRKLEEGIKNSKSVKKYDRYYSLT